MIRRYSYVRVNYLLKKGCDFFFLVSHISVGILSTLRNSIRMSYGVKSTIRCRVASISRAKFDSAFAEFNDLENSKPVTRNVDTDNRTKRKFNSVLESFGGGAVTVS